MADRAGQARLPLEPLASRRIGCGVRAEDLDRDLAPEASVERSVDLAHPARAERGLHLVGAEPKARRKPHPRVQSVDRLHRHGAPFAHKAEPWR